MKDPSQQLLSSTETVVPDDADLSALLMNPKLSSAGYHQPSPINVDDYLQRFEKMDASDKARDKKKGSSKRKKSSRRRSVPKMIHLDVEEASTASSITHHDYGMRTSARRSMSMTQFSSRLDAVDGCNRKTTAAASRSKSMNEFSLLQSSGKADKNPFLSSDEGNSFSLVQSPGKPFKIPFLSRNEGTTLLEDAPAVVVSQTDEPANVAEEEKEEIASLKPETDCEDLHETLRRQEGIEELDGAPPAKHKSRRSKTAETVRRRRSSTTERGRKKTSRRAASMGDIFKAEPEEKTVPAKPPAVAPKQTASTDDLPMNENMAGLLEEESAPVRPVPSKQRTMSVQDFDHHQQQRRRPHMEGPRRRSMSMNDIFQSNNNKFAGKNSLAMQRDFAHPLKRRMQRRRASTTDTAAPQERRDVIKLFCPVLAD